MFSKTLVKRDMGWYHLKKKTNLEKALELAERAYELSPLNTSVIDTLAEIHITLGNYGKAKELFQKALTIETSEERKVMLEQKLDGLHNK